MLTINPSAKALVEDILKKRSMLSVVHQSKHLVEKDPIKNVLMDAKRGAKDVARLLVDNSLETLLIERISPYIKGRKRDSDAEKHLRHIIRGHYGALFTNHAIVEKAEDLVTQKILNHVKGERIASQAKLEDLANQATAYKDSLEAFTRNLISEDLTSALPLAEVREKHLEEIPLQSLSLDAMKKTNIEPLIRDIETHVTNRLRDKVRAHREGYIKRLKKRKHQLDAIMHIKEKGKAFVETYKEKGEHLLSRKREALIKRATERLSSFSKKSGGLL